MDEGGGLAAELERDRSEVVSGCLHDELADGGGAGEEKVVEGQSGECGCDLLVTSDGGDVLVREGCVDDSANYFGGLRCVLGRFDDDVVAGGERVGEWRECEQDWVVPRADDADDSEGLVEDAGAAGQELPVCRDAARAHPAAEVAFDESDLVDEREEFENAGFDYGTVAEVFADCDDEFVLMIDDALKQIAEGFEARFERERSASVEGGFLTIEDREQRIELGFGVLKTHRRRLIPARFLGKG